MIVKPRNHSPDLRDRAIDILHQDSEILFARLFQEFPQLERFISASNTYHEFCAKIRIFARKGITGNPAAIRVYEDNETHFSTMELLRWKDIAAIRILDYLDYENTAWFNPNTQNTVISAPFMQLWQAYQDDNATLLSPDFLTDMIHLFRQLFSPSEPAKPTSDQVLQWIQRHHSGLNSDIRLIHKKNKIRILNKILDRMRRGLIRDLKYQLDPNLSHEKQFEQAVKWWNESYFHLRMAARDPDTLNDYLDHSLSSETMTILHEAVAKGIPFFVNPYYASLLIVQTDQPDLLHADAAIRSYIFYSQELVKTFGDIVAWEMEDTIEPGVPNAAGWILPTRHNLHRRYPEVAVLIPDSMGRACGGLCSSCQRMYDFQSGRLNFNLESLRPDEKWNIRLRRLMDYFENDSQLRDILITGGDAFMSADRTLEHLFSAILHMAERKRNANKDRADGEKYAEILRIRLGTRLPVYLPQRVTPNLVRVLTEFRENAETVGIKQFIIQTHFESPLEVTSESRHAINELISAGWTITNQHVFTVASSRRGHNACLRRTLNEIGVLPYYTFTVKGYRENAAVFTPNARLVQEEQEEKRLDMQENTPFISSDRSVINLPGVGKSLHFRVIGITPDGCRILKFDYDSSRRHSPIIHSDGNVVIIESKSLSAYLRQLSRLGENPEDYQSVFGYSISSMPPRSHCFDYPAYPFRITDTFTNLDPDLLRSDETVQIERQ